MRRIPRLRQPSLLAAAPIQCTCAAPATLPIHAARRALSTTPASNAGDRLRKALWKDDASIPADPYAAENSQALQQQLLERELAEAEAQLAEFEAQAADAQRSEKQNARRRPNTRLDGKLKNQRKWAPTTKEAEKQGYVPAQTIDGLEEVGGLEAWWEQGGRWGKESRYVGFARKDKVVDPNLCEVYVRQAVVEALAFGASGDRDLVTSTSALPHSRKVTSRALHVQLTVGPDGSASIAGAPEERISRINRDVVGHTQVVEEVQDVSAERAKEIVASWDKSWKGISLQDARFKFSVHKRVFQLTGQYIHDAKLAQIGTVGDLIAAVITPPKPTKVAEAVRERGELLELPNVKVHDRRITPIDKETAVGRWKVIVEELEKRGLPVTGHEQLPQPVQRKWIQGRA
ncbi:hypothetical protein CCHL11_02475 [Colletotrichum chlorophyti]|uniref:Large ribosomal subunit protein mL50 n=1 Tax=Colletotrichum chlorophyti TaxID=708187 RepID=A0A1Q8S8Y0_9PEZI|nr:hypothetical protein CCHL11_02475 [Colletotrichum chlorophyti]